MPHMIVVAPFLISQCYNTISTPICAWFVVAPFLISQCYNPIGYAPVRYWVVAPFLISQCYNASAGNPYSVRISRFLLFEKKGLEQQ